MALRRHDADVVIFGYSLEAALTAALVSKRGAKVVWLGGAPEATVAVGRFRLPAAPGLMPAFAHAPALGRSLRDVGLLVDVQRIQRPTSLQCLGTHLRISLAEDWLRMPDGAAGIKGLQECATTADTVSATALTLGFFARRRFRRATGLIQQQVAGPDGIVGDTVKLIDSLFGRAEMSLSSMLQTAASPVDIPGGTLFLGQALQKKCADHNARLFPDGLKAPLAGLHVRFNGIEGALASGEVFTGKVLLLATGEETLTRALPERSPLLKKIETRETKALLRFSFVIRRRGLPQALGTFALIQGPPPLWIERRRVDDEHDGLNIFWRQGGADAASEGQQALAALERIAPFSSNHTVATAPPEAVPDHEWIGTSADVVMGRRVLRSSGPLLGACGPEGAAIIAQAFAEHALKIAGKPPTAG